MVQLWTLQRTLNKCFGTPIWGTVYISEANGDMNVKSDEHAGSYEQELRSRGEIFSLGGWGTVPPT